MKRILLLLIVVVAAYFLYAKSRTNAPTQSEAERNRAFTEAMSGVVLIGQSTRTNKDGVFGPERYAIDGVTHVSGDTWVFRTRMDVQGKELPVPIPLTLKWAGDTPVITMTDLAIPGVGTYTARVLLYREQYAGTWSGTNGVGGTLFGKIERGGAAKKP